MSDEASTNTDYDEGEHCKDVYAYFGRAFYEAGVVETGLSLTVMHLDFLTKEAEKWRRDGMSSFVRADYEAAFDAFMEQLQSKTLGDLIKALKRLSVLPPTIVKLLDDTNRKRNFLTHHFFRESAVRFTLRKGRDEMIAELDEAHTLFLITDRTVTEWAKPFREKIGLNEKTFERYYAEFIASLPKDD